MELQAQKEHEERELKQKEMEMEVRLKELELNAQSGNSSPQGRQTARFDINRNLSSVPQFEEDNIEGFFRQFEKAAKSLKWPKENMAFLAQSRFVGKAKKAFNALSDEDSDDYDIVKQTVFTAYELVPEAAAQIYV